MSAREIIPMRRPPVDREDQQRTDTSRRTDGRPVREGWRERLLNNDGLLKVWIVILGITPIVLMAIVLLTR